MFPINVFYSHEVLQVLESFLAPCLEARPIFVSRVQGACRHWIRYEFYFLLDIVQSRVFSDDLDLLSQLSLDIHSM